MADLSLAEAVTDEFPELVFAIVSPVGTDLEYFKNNFTDLIRQFGYSVNELRLSKLAERLHSEKLLGQNLDFSTEHSRINSLMSAGNLLRQAARRGDILALHAIAEIASGRTSEDGVTQPRPKTVHLLRSLKHPAEVEALRRVYGPGFFLIGLLSREEERLRTLTQMKGLSAPQAEQVIARDQGEDDNLGQQTRDTFYLADVFLRADDRDQLARFIDLVFGHPYKTPTPEEHAMFLAFGSALRSAQLARQVGAVVVSSDGELISTGANDVPKFGGGLYWCTDNDQRDHVKGEDSNDRTIGEITEDVLRCIRQELMLDEAQIGKIKAALSTSKVADLTEYGRAVHAEMEALLSCARTGAETKGGTLYTTTFPCHNCAKHIVAAGILRVIYVEPYPKSKALEHHSDAIVFDAIGPQTKVNFIPFEGVAARRFFDLFSMKLSSGLPLKRKASGRIVGWERATAKPRARMSPYSYTEREKIAIDFIETAVEGMETADTPAGTESGTVVAIEPVEPRDADTPKP